MTPSSELHRLKLTLKERDGEIERLREALRKIEIWDSHPVEWSLIDKVNFYRKIATEALESIHSKEKE